MTRLRVSSVTPNRFAKYGLLLGAVMLGSAGGWQLFAAVLDVTMPHWELRLLLDAELFGVGIGSLALVGALVSRPDDDVVPSARVTRDTTVHVTGGLLDVLLRFAEEAEPRDCTIGLATTPALSLTDCPPDLPSSTPVFTHFYMPDAARSTRDVFGIDLGIPPGRTRGLFHSHPQGPLAVTKRDDLHGVVLVATPPWDRESVAAFDRSGRRHPLRVVDATPPTESIPGRPGD